MLTSADRGLACLPSHQEHHFLHELEYEDSVFDRHDAQSILIVSSENPAASKVALTHYTRLAGGGLEELRDEVPGGD